MRRAPRVAPCAPCVAGPAICARARRSTPTRDGDRVALAFNCVNAPPASAPTSASASAADAALATPAIAAGGGELIVRGMPAVVYEAGIAARTVVIKYASVEAAIATHDSPAYQAALAALGDGAEREIRICEGAV